MSQKSYDDSASLYLIPTPIGNLDDITVRSLKTLETVDFILCEDTRETGKLLSKYNIKKKLVSCHEFNEDKIKSNVVDELSKGMNIGLVTDQGTPIISDPGYIIAREVIRCGYNVISLPGATAFVPALTSSGISPSPFIFYGFLNAKNSKQKSELEALKNLKYTMIFYESVHRIKDTLEDLYEVLGNRSACISRELTKLHEEFIRGHLEELITLDEQTLKGEMVIVVEGAKKESINYNESDLIKLVNDELKRGISLKEACQEVSKLTGEKKNKLYQLMIKTK